MRATGGVPSAGTGPLASSSDHAPDWSVRSPTISPRIGWGEISTWQADKDHKDNPKKSMKQGSLVQEILFMTAPYWIRRQEPKPQRNKTSSPSPSVTLSKSVGSLPWAWAKNTLYSPGGTLPDLILPRGPTK